MIIGEFHVTKINYHKHMKTIKRTEMYDAPADIVFSYLDDLGVTGMHMTKPSMMMSSKLKLAFLTNNHIGQGTKYRWTGTMMGIKLTSLLK